MSNYSVAQAKSNFSRLIDEAISGEVVTITRHGKPAVELRPAPPRPLSLSRGKLIDEIAARAKLRPSLGASGVEIVRAMRDGEM